MTAKEKAVELVDKFAKYSHTDFDYSKGGYQVKSQIANAKECALIAVDEILGEIYSNKIITSDEKRIFWQQVKTEIEKL